VIVLLKHVTPEGERTMMLKDRLLFVVIAVAIVASMFIGLSVIVDNVNAAPLHPAIIVGGSSNLV
jgi:hypothetical protein